MNYQSEYLDFPREILSNREHNDLMKGSVNFEKLKRLEKVLEARIFEFVYGAAKQEGNNYTRREATHLLSTGRTSDNQKVSDTIMLLNLDAAYKYILEKPEINRKTLRELHGILSDKLIYRGYCGDFRNLPVEIVGTDYKPLSSKSMITLEVDKILSVQKEVKSPFDRAIYLNCNLAYLQAFMDVNKRVAKFIQSLSLMNDGLTPLFIKEKDNKAHVDSLLEYYESGDYTPYKEVFIRCYEEQMKEIKDLFLGRDKD